MPENRFAKFLTPPDVGPTYQPDPIVKRAPAPKDPPAPKTSYRSLTADEITARGLNPKRVYQESSEGRLLDVGESSSNAISEEDLAAVRAEARQKIKLIDSLKQRSRDGWFATGFGSSIASSVNGTTASDVAKDVQTVAASGALQRIMEMARNNGGKNPLTPLSNADFQALGQSIANLDPGLSDERFQANLDTYRDIYLRAFKAAGGQTTGGKGSQTATRKRLRYNPATGELE